MRPDCQITEAFIVHVLEYTSFQSRNKSEVHDYIDVFIFHCGCTCTDLVTGGWNYGM